MPKELNNHKKELFAQFYINRCNEKTYSNATQSAIEAGYSPKSAYVQGSRLLRDDRVKELIAEAHKAEAEATKLSKDAVEMECWRNYLKATNASEKYKYFQLYCSLSGMLIQRSEVKEERTVTLENGQREAIMLEARRALEAVKTPKRDPSLVMSTTSPENEPTEPLEEKITEGTDNA